jgi:hypothetical protein
VILLLVPAALATIPPRFDVAVPRYDDGAGDELPLPDPPGWNPRPGTIVALTAASVAGTALVFVALANVLFSNDYDVSSPPPALQRR